MSPYLSLSWKFLLILLSILLLALAGFSSLSLLHVNEQFNRQQQQKKQQGQQYFELYGQTIEQQLTVWMQSFAELQQLAQAENFQAFANSLSQHLDTLQLYYAVERLQLYDNTTLLLHTGETPTLTDTALARQVLQQQTPLSVIHCTTHCVRQVGLPLLNGKGEVAVLLLSSALTDVFLSLHKTLNVEVGVLRYQASAAAPLKLLQSSNHVLLQALYAAMPQPLVLDAVLAEGVLLHHAGKSYYLQLVPLEQQHDAQYLMLLVDDISGIVRQSQRYKQRILLVAGGCFMLFLWLISYSTRRLTKRLQGISAALPLLAQKQYQRFLLLAQPQPVWLRDEISLFSAEVLQLGEELERLDHQLTEQTAELQLLALYDELTALGNRHLLRQTLQQLLSQSGAIGLLFLDLDKFQNINNSRTHVAGDSILQQTAERLLQLLPEHASAFRFGGDEFALLWPACGDTGQLQQLAEAVLDSFNQVFSLPNGNASLTASIGLCWRGSEALSAEEMLRRADLAMYQAKQQGRNCIFTFTGQMLTELASRLQLEGELRQAVRDSAFFLCLQPQVDLRRGALCGFEALLRWRHPQRGLVAPDQFIPVLEQAQLMNEVGYWVFERSCQLCIQLMQAGLNNVRIAVNLTADQFLDPELAPRFAALLARYQLSGSNFELELTESTLVQQMHITLQTMNLLKQQGFVFAIDDFGTGYSSLSYLTKIPVDSIKIDRSFVMNMLARGGDFQIVVSTIAMVKKLGLQVVAEGVETLEQLNLLQQYQCDVVQGYYFSRPVPEDELVAFVQQLHSGWPAQLLQSAEA